MPYSHPNENGGGNSGSPTVTAVSPCPECIAESVCPKCDRDGMVEWGAVRICVYCGFTFDEAAEPQEEQS